ncbi:hypothetical protein AK88_05157, partial [Plasmodium fragile]
MRGMPLGQIIKKNSPSQALIKSAIHHDSSCCACKRRFSFFRSKLWSPTENIIYRKNLDISCKSHVFFYTVLNVDRYSHFLPYVTKSKITDKAEEHFKAVLQIENLLFKESYDSVIRFKVPTTVK